MAKEKDTIIAPATPVGDSGIAVVRISGNRAPFFLQSVFRSYNNVKVFDSHHLYLGKIHDDNNHVIDEVMAVYMAPPRTYTREAVVEIHCHGSQQIVSRILDLAYNYNIRLALPGEFTYRAYLSGRLDLVQAEAVSRLIQSTSELSRKSAVQQLEGFLSRQLYFFSTSVKQILVHIEAWVDFPEEDIPTEMIHHLSDTLKYVYRQMSELADTYIAGQFVHDGAIVALAGLPNAGKSSLMNLLLREDRSIVSSVPGTTRDTIEQTLQLDDIRVRLVDTAGLRESNDYVENEGVRRAKSILNRANLVLFVFDGTCSPGEEVQHLFSYFHDIPTVLVVNKSDLIISDPDLSFFQGPVVHISAKLGHGLADLKEMISTILVRDYLTDSEQSYLTERRHYEALSAAATALERVLDNIGVVEPDILSIDLRECLQALASITGEVSSESILDDIFSSFCIGK